MKIALIRKEFKASFGGAEQYAVQLGRRLADRGNDVHIFSGLWDKESEHCMKLHKVPFIPFPSWLKNLSFQYSAHRVVQKESFDIIQGLSQVYPQDVYRVGDGLHCHWIRMQAPSPVRRILKYLSLRHLVILAIERQIFRPENYRRIIVNSRLCQGQVINYYGVPETKIHVIYNGVNLEKFHPYVQNGVRKSLRSQMGIGREDVVLLFAGHNFRRKGLEFAIGCAAALKKNGCRVKLIVSGRGNRRPFLRLAVSKDFEKEIIFTGPVKNMEKMYWVSDILIHPAWYDPFSNVCLESMACGRPVLTTRYNGASEIINDGTSGFIVDYPWQIKEMVHKMESVLAGNMAKLQNMGAQAFDVAATYSIKKNIALTLKVYQDVLQEKGGMA